MSPDSGHDISYGEYRSGNQLYNPISKGKFSQEMQNLMKNKYRIRVLQINESKWLLKKKNDKQKEKIKLRNPIKH